MKTLAITSIAIIALYISLPAFGDYILAANLERLEAELVSEVYNLGKIQCSTVESLWFGDRAEPMQVELIDSIKQKIERIKSM